MTFARTLIDLRPGHFGVRPANVAQLLGNGHDRVQGVHGALHHDRIVPPADVAEPLLRQVHHVVAFEIDGAAGYQRRRVEQASEGKKERRFSAPAFPDDGQELAPGQVQVHIVDRAHHPRVGVVAHR
jgi:hypothetical protein